MILDKEIFLKKSVDKHCIFIYVGQGYSDMDYVQSVLNAFIFSFEYKHDIPVIGNIFVLYDGLPNDPITKEQEAIAQYCDEKDIDIYMFNSDDPDLFVFFDEKCDGAILFITHSEDVFAQSLVIALERHNVPYSVYNDEE